MVPALKILMLLTILSIAPGILICMTSFRALLLFSHSSDRLLGTQNVPPMQVVLALAMLFTGVVMAPVAATLHEEALGPYRRANRRRHFGSAATRWSPPGFSAKHAKMISFSS